MGDALEKKVMPAATPANGQSSDLIVAAKRGDRDALLRLLQVSRANIRRIADLECASSADADDATQETLLAVYHRIGVLRTITSYTSWLFSIVRHECQRLMRRMRSELPLPPEDDAIFAYSTAPELRLDLAAALESLPDKYREAIILRDFEEYSITEIAQALRLSRAAIKSRIHRGRVMIREYLDD